MADPDRRAWTLVERAIPAGWFRGKVPDALDTRLDILLDAAARAAAAGRGPGVVDLDGKQELEARMLQSYAVRASTRAVRDDDPALAHRAALALVIGSPAADYRDQLRVIAVLAHAAGRVGTSLAEVIARLRPSWDEMHLCRLVDFDTRPHRERRLRVMEYSVQAGARPSPTSPGPPATPPCPPAGSPTSWRQPISRRTWSRTCARPPVPSSDARDVCERGRAGQPPRRDGDRPWSVGRLWCGSSQEVAPRPPRTPPGRLGPRYRPK